MCGEQWYSIAISDLWAVSVLYGSIYVLVYRRPNTYHLLATILLFLLTTATMGISLGSVLGEPILTSSSTIVDGNTVGPCASGSPERVHEALRADRLEVVTSALTVCMVFIADSVLVYRCIVLWSRRLGRWIGFLLLLLLLAEAATGVAQTYYAAAVYLQERQQTPGSEGTFSQKWIDILNTLANFGVANSSLGLSVNIISTILIASRIWFMAHQLEKTLGGESGVRYRAAMSMIIESGLLISASQLVVTCITNIESVTIYGALVSDICQMLLVIAPTLIIVRVGMGQGFDNIVETLHDNHASRGVHETHLKSIRFAEYHTTDTSHLASMGGITQSTGPESATDVRSTDNDSKHSGILEKCESTGQTGVERIV
ncbi:hypothetical protein DENSPDRAFT_87963 [Dentipellis sp. KUC8613]|nr:hypothetical protein DENSPDRAFT_87963 [Dentipellis sp. KUC8613]